MLCCCWIGLDWIVCWMICAEDRSLACHTRLVPLIGPEAI